MTSLRLALASGPLALLAAIALAAALLAACGGDRNPEPAATATGAAPVAAVTPRAASPTATPSPAAAPPPARAPVVDAGAERAFEHIRVLAVEIGERFAGTDAEREAAAYVAAQLEAVGYVVAIEEFDVRVPFNDASVAIEGEGGPISAFPLGESESGEASGRLVFAGLGDSADFAGAEAEGAIVLLDRGVLTFARKAANAQAAGAAGVVIVNSEPGELFGTLGRDAGVSIPVIGVAGSLGSALRALAADGAEVSIRSRTSSEEQTSQNVVGRPEDGDCRAYLGAHYDSVPGSPGANDNASGTALLIELARVSRSEGIGEGLCFIAFGAEEIGLFGSQAFVEAHDVSAATFMLNFDMVARIGERTGDGARFVAGDEALADRAASVATDLGYGIPRGAFPRGTSSDHVSFSAAGVPAITVHSGGSDFIHAPEDTIDTVFVEDLAILLEVSIALLQALFEG